MWNATYSVPSVHHASSRRALVSMPNALMAWSTVSATFCVLLIFTIKLTLALGGCRSALSPEVANTTTTVLGLDFIPRKLCAHLLTATGRAVERVESLGSCSE